MPNWTPEIPHRLGRTAHRFARPTGPPWCPAGGPGGIGKPRENQGKPWENRGKAMGKPEKRWENRGETVGKPWFKMEKKTTGHLKIYEDV